jgi:hypothetical protein
MGVARFEEILEKACPELPCGGSVELTEGQLDILRCHYNFFRPHRALKVGPEILTPAMQVGLAKRRLSFRDVFTFLFTIV